MHGCGSEDGITGPIDMVRTRGLGFNGTSEDGRGGQGGIWGTGRDPIVGQLDITPHVEGIVNHS